MESAREVRTSAAGPHEAPQSAHPPGNGCRASDPGPSTLELEQTSIADDPSNEMPADGANHNTWDGAPELLTWLNNAHSVSDCRVYLTVLRASPISNASRRSSTVSPSRSTSVIVCGSFGFDGDLPQVAGEPEPWLVGRRHRCAPVGADVEGVVGREDDRDGLVDAALGQLLVVDRQRPGAALTRRRRRRRSQSGSCTSRPAVSRRRRSCSTRGRASCSRRSACPSALRARRRTPARLLTPTSRGRRIPRGLGRSQKVASCVVGRAGLVAHVLTACVAQRLCLIAGMQCLPSRWP